MLLVHLAAINVAIKFFLQEKAEAESNTGLKSR
jgi:hypothetical protein